MSYNFPWQEDHEGEYLLLRTNSGRYELRQTDTDLYIFPNYIEGDHIWHEVECDNDEEVAQGFRMFKSDVDILGEGAYEALVDDMKQRYFTQIVADEMSEYDKQAFINKFGHEPEKADLIGRVVDLALKNFDDGWRYYSEEWQ